MPKTRSGGEGKGGVDRVEWGIDMGEEGKEWDEGGKDGVVSEGWETGERGVRGGLM